MTDSNVVLLNSELPLPAFVKGKVRGSELPAQRSGARGAGASPFSPPWWRHGPYEPLSLWGRMASCAAVLPHCRRPATPRTHPWGSPNGSLLDPRPAPNGPGPDPALRSLCVSGLLLQFHQNHFKPLVARIRGRCPGGRPVDCPSLGRDLLRFPVGRGHTSLAVGKIDRHCIGVVMITGFSPGP